MAESDVRQPTKSTAPAVAIKSVTLDAAINPPSRAIWVGAAGDVAVTTVAGDQETIPGVPAGTLLPVAVTMIRTTGTTIAAASLKVWR